MNAIGYLRISTKDQSEYSLDYQERLIREYCTRHSLQLLSVFKDDGQSSYTFDRPDWQALEAFIRKSRNVDCLIVVDLDRFSRNLAEALMKIQELRTKYKIRVLSTSDNFDTDFEDPSNFMIRAFKLMMAESELHNIRRRTKNGNIQGALSGRFLNMAPYGYTNGRDLQDKPVLLVHETRAEIVRTIFREFLSGMEIGQIKRRVADMGYRQGSHSALQRILTNQVYIGMVPVPPHKGRKRPWIRGLQVPIISEQDFWLVQERLGGRQRALHDNHETPLRGVLHCHCGRRVTAGNSRSHTGKVYWYYLCQEHRRNLPARQLHKQFDRILDLMSIPPERMEWLRRKLLADIEQYAERQEETAARLAKELKALQLQRKAAERRHLVSGNTSETVFNEVIGEFAADEKRLKDGIAALSQDPGQYVKKLHELLTALSHVKSVVDVMPLEKQHQFLNIGFDTSLSHDGRSFRATVIHPLLAGQEAILSEQAILVIDDHGTGQRSIPDTANPAPDAGTA